SYSSIWFATKARLSLGRCCCSTFGTSISTLQPTSSTFMLDGSVAKSTLRNPIHLFTPSAALGFASVLLAKTLRSQTFKLALISIAIFGAIVIALLGYVYWSTASYLRSRSDDTINAELTSLVKTYESVGRSGLVALIAQRIAEHRLEGGVYLLA